MLYSTIKYLSASTCFLLGRHGANGGYIEPNLTLDQDIHCGDAHNDICIINCNISFTWAASSRFPNVYCGNTTKCIINCSGDFCLRESYIHANHTKHLQLISQGSTGCVRDGYFHLPDHGNATIIGDSNGINHGILKTVKIYSGTHTDTINIECNDSGHSDTSDDCNGLQIHAQTAQYITITINGASFKDSIVYCPMNSALSPSCIINADSASSTENLQIYALKGMPQDVVFYSNGTIHGNYTGTTITCVDALYNNHTSIIQSNTFFGRTCFVTLVPTTEPTIEPTIEPTVEPTIISTIETNDNSDDDDPSKGMVMFFNFLRNISLEILLLFLIGITISVGCCVVALYVILKKKKELKKQLERKEKNTSSKIAIRNRDDDVVPHMRRLATNDKVSEMKHNASDDNVVPQIKHDVTDDGQTRLPPPLPKIVSHNEEKEIVHVDEYEDEDVVNIVVSSRGHIRDAVASTSNFTVELDQSSSSDTIANQDNTTTKGATTKGNDTSSDSSFSSSSARGGITDIGDMVLQVMGADHPGEDGGEVGEDAHDIYGSL